MDMDTARKLKLYNLSLPLLLQKDVPFYQELIWLQYNETFCKLIEETRVREKIQIQKMSIVQEGDFLAKAVAEHETLLPDVMSIVDRCKLGESKYKHLLIEEIMSYLLYGNFVSIGTEIMLQKIQIQSLTPTSSLKIEPSDRRVTLTVSFLFDTKDSSVLATIKEKLQEVTKYKQIHKISRISPKRDWLRDYQFYVEYVVKGKSYDAIKKSYEEEKKKKITREGVINAIQRIREKIDTSFH